MRYILALLFCALPLTSQTVVPDSFTVQPGAPAPVIAMLDSDYKAEADANGDESVSAAEAIAWLSSRRQNVFNHFTVKAVVRAETDDRSLLPQAHRNALAALDAAKAAIAEQRERLCPGCDWPPL